MTGHNPSSQPQTIVGFANPSGSGKGNWSAVELHDRAFPGPCSCRGTADSKSFRVLMLRDRCDEDSGRVWVSIAAAIGPADAQNQARELMPDGAPLKAEAA